MSVNSTATILVGCSNRTVWIRVIGKGSFLCSTHLKDFTREMINRGYREFALDLAECPVMDSTFMGTLAGVALRLRDVGQGALHIVNPNPRNLDLLEGLGLDQLFSMEPTELLQPPPGRLDPATPGAGESQAALSAEKGDTSRTMLEAHEALVQADSANLTKFKDVLEFLRQDLDEKRTG